MTTTTRTDEQTARLDLTKAIAKALRQDNKTCLQRHGLQYKAVTKCEGEIIETISTPYQGDRTSYIVFRLGVDADGRAYATGFECYAVSDTRGDWADGVDFTGVRGMPPALAVGRDSAIRREVVLVRRFVGFRRIA